MSKKKFRRIVSMELSEVSACHTPAQSLAVATLQKSAPEPTSFTKATPAGMAAIAALSAAMKSEPVTKSKEPVIMSDNRTTAEIIKSRRERDGGSDLEAFNAVKDSREFAEAYDKEEAETAELRRRTQERTSY